MLDEAQATAIVVDCIRAVSHVGVVDITRTLDDAQVSDSARVQNMNTLIVNSNNIGVPSQRHRINSAFLQNISPSSSVFSVIDIVKEKSVRIHDDPLEDLASMVARHLSVQMEDSGKKTGKKSTKKSTKKSKSKAKKSGK
jgi:hypothetical protein